MARLKRIDPKKLAAKLKRKPKVSAESRARIDALVKDEAHRKTMYARAAALEEIIETQRENVLRGMESATKLTIRAHKDLGELLRHKDAEKTPGRTGLQSLPPWLQAKLTVADAAPKAMAAAAAPATPDDLDLDAALAAAQKPT